MNKFDPRDWEPSPEEELESERFWKRLAHHLRNNPDELAAWIRETEASIRWGEMLLGLYGLSDDELLDMRNVAIAMEDSEGDMLAETIDEILTERLEDSAL